MGWRKELKKHIKAGVEFRKELRSTLDSTDRTLKSLIAKIQKDELSVGSRDLLIERLMDQNEKLMDRLLARNLPELKTYSLPGGELFETGRSYVPEEDEDLVGTVVPPELFENRTREDG